MSRDELRITTDTDEIDVSVEKLPDLDVIVGSIPDEVVMLPVNELNVMVESKEIEIQINDQSPDIELNIDSSPDVIFLPTTGLTGPPGPEGPEGPPGPPGSTAAETTYTFTQVGALAVWNIVHNLGRYPAVTVVDSGGTEIIPDVHYISANEIDLHFFNPTSGKAYLN